MNKGLHKSLFSPYQRLCSNNLNKPKIKKRAYSSVLLLNLGLAMFSLACHASTVSQCETTNPDTPDSFYDGFFITVDGCVFHPNTPLAKLPGGKVKGKPGKNCPDTYFHINGANNTTLKVTTILNLLREQTGCPIIGVYSYHPVSLDAESSTEEDRLLDSETSFEKFEREISSLKNASSNNTGLNNAEISLYNILKDNLSSGTIGIIASSHGAVVAKNAMQRLFHDTFSALGSIKETRKYMSTITIETLGASADFCVPGSRCIHYINVLDPIAMTFINSIPKNNETNAIFSFSEPNPFFEIVGESEDESSSGFRKAFLSVHGIKAYLKYLKPFDDIWVKRKHRFIGETVILNN